jgi:hypothetical protein
MADMPRPSLRDRISTENTHSLRRNDAKAEPQPLTPLAQRLLATLRQLAKQYDELSMLVKGFERMHRKNPWSDQEMIDTLALVRDYINVIMDDQQNAPKTVDAEVV